MAFTSFSDESITIKGITNHQVELINRFSNRFNRFTTQTGYNPVTIRLQFRAVFGQFQSSFRAISEQFQNTLRAVFVSDQFTVNFASLVGVWGSGDTTFPRTIFRAVSERFQSSFRAVSEKLQSNFRAVFGQFQSSFRAFAEQFQSSFRKASEQFQSSF